MLDQVGELFVRLAGHAADVDYFDAVVLLDAGMRVMMADVDTIGTVCFSKCNGTTDHTRYLTAAIAGLLIEPKSQAGEPFFYAVHDAIAEVRVPREFMYPAVELVAMDGHVPMSADFPAKKNVFRKHPKAQPGNMGIQVAIVMIALDEYFFYWHSGDELFESYNIRSARLADRVIVHVAEHDKAVRGDRLQRLENAGWLVVESAEVPIRGNQCGAGF